MRNLVVITTRFPFPLNKGDKLRLFHQIKYLSKEFKIHLLCTSSTFVFNIQIQELMPYCESIQVFPIRKYELVFNTLKSIFSKIPFQVTLFFTKRIEKKINARIAEIENPLFYFQLSRTSLYAKNKEKKAVLDLQDAFSINYKRTLDQVFGLKKMFYYLEWKRMMAYEKKLIQTFKQLTIIAEYDKKVIDESAKNLTVISNGVDEKYYRPQQKEIKYDILFSGNLNYLPNEKAAIYLIATIFPALLKKIPTIQIAIAGDFNSSKIKKISHPQIHILGKVDDMRDAYATSKIYVAPLFTGAGLQNKLLEAMSMVLPCITTSIANVSLFAENETSILIAENADEFVTQILRLTTDKDLYQKISIGGKMHIHHNFSWENANKKLSTLLKSL
ncbi:MAG: glycosyltransferase [Chitinophagaceae bacterium]|nr:glycosyltransferase [Chitinophagaceae bacterium]